MFSLISSNGLISIYAKGAFYSKKVILIRKIVTYLYVLLFTVPCESGNYWKCDVSSCVACPQGFYQPQWGQTSCWPCPFNTTTDFEGASSPTECKREYFKKKYSSNSTSLIRNKIVHVSVLCIRSRPGRRPALRRPLGIRVRPGRTAL